jgi:hypothetical protein
MERYLLLARGSTRTSTKAKGPTIRASIEQLSRDPTVKATYGYIENGQVVFALLCEVPSAREAEQLATMAQMYGLPCVEALPLLPVDDLRAGFEEGDREAHTLLVAQPSDTDLSLSYRQAS